MKNETSKQKTPGLNGLIGYFVEDAEYTPSQLSNISGVPISNIIPALKIYHDAGLLLKIKKKKGREHHYKKVS